ncbi:hypothetical protein BC830DRAFT_1141081 [Chytriomyces sp. MP71]|nr:hypothetical protein BC830DRAFT_1141081 [Chytriomyces sp. MP71]
MFHHSKFDQGKSSGVIIGVSRVAHVVSNLDHREQGLSLQNSFDAFNEAHAFAKAL